MISVMMPAIIKPEAHLMTSSSAFIGASSICRSRFVTSSWSDDASRYAAAIASAWLALNPLASSVLTNFNVSNVTVLIMSLSKLTEIK